MEVELFLNKLSSFELKASSQVTVLIDKLENKVICLLKSYTDDVQNNV